MNSARLGSALAALWLAGAAAAQTVEPGVFGKDVAPRAESAPVSPAPHAEAAGHTGSLLDLKAEPLIPGEESHAEHVPETPPDAEKPTRIWARAEYLLWYMKESPIPALVTIGSASDPIPGGLGQPGTKVEFGGGDVDTYNRAGGRFVVGTWLGDEQRLGVEGGYFFLASRAVRFGLNSLSLPGDPVIARPFFDTITQSESSGLVAFPNLATGSIDARFTSRMQGAEANGVLTFLTGDHIRIEGIAGFRYIQLEEEIDVFDSMTVLPNGPKQFAGSSIQTIDQFGTHNNFYGAQFGSRMELTYGRWSLELAGKVAFGEMYEDLQIKGSTTITPTPTFKVQPGGFLALASNIGDLSRSEFAVVPETSVTLGYQVTDHMKVTCGYTYLYLSRVLRPGDAIDRNLNSNLIPLSLSTGGGPLTPTAVLRDTDFWAQGLTFGAEFKY